MKISKKIISFFNYKYMSLNFKSSFNLKQYDFRLKTRPKIQEKEP